MLRLLAFCVAAFAGSCVPSTRPQSAPASTTSAAADSIHTRIPAPWVYPGATVPCPKVAGWVRGEPIVRFAPRTIYVFDFFSTTCDHCEEVGPLVAELARIHQPQGVVFVGVSAERKEIIAQWLASPPQKDDITYRIASDPAHAADRALQDGTLRRATPILFIVRDGIVQWYGHPNEAQAPLEAIVAGTWDPASVKDRFVKDARMFSAKAKIEALARECEKSGQWAPMFELLDALNPQFPEERTQFDVQRFVIMIGIAGQPEAGYVLGREIALRNPRDAVSRRAMARTTVNSPFARVRDLDFALAMALEANALGREEDPLALAALAMVHFARGNREKAIEAQERAIELQKDPGLLTTYRGDLEKYRTQPPGPLEVKAAASATVKSP
ncbi:MAG: redoxin domain-containing protein [Phycisphaerales bacterium]|nr:redoxin domain-containing protein [Phycisphaerales bacterium]